MHARTAFAARTVTLGYCHHETRCGSVATATAAAEDEEWRGRQNVINDEPFGGLSETRTEIRSRAALAGP